MRALNSSRLSFVPVKSIFCFTSLYWIIKIFIVIALPVMLYRRLKCTLLRKKLYRHKQWVHQSLLMKYCLIADRSVYSGPGYLPDCFHQRSGNYRQQTKAFHWIKLSLPSGLNVADITLCECPTKLVRRIPETPSYILASFS